MKKLMMTTAIVAMTSMGAIAQTADTTTDTTAQTGAESGAMGQNVPAFVVSNFTGKNLYTLDSEAAMNLRGDGMQADESMRWDSSETFTGERDAWEDVGSISDVVISKDGEVRGVLIDVGGFLGLGARTVMVDINELYFVSDEAADGTATDTTAAEGVEDFSIVAAMTEEQLEALPEWDENRLNEGFESRSTVDNASMTTPTDGSSAVGTEAGEQAQTDQTEQTQTGQTQTDAAAPADGMGSAGTPEGYTQMNAEDRTAERLIGANAYGAQGEDMATVDDLVLDADGAATHVIMDVGGFLGMGTHTVAIEIDQVDILWNDQDGDVMVQVPMTEDQLRELPAYEG